MISSFFINYTNELSLILKEIDSSEFAKLIDEIVHAYNNNGQIFIFGNGGCAALSSHITCDINKGVSLSKSKRFKFVCLNDNIPIMLAYSNDIDYSVIFIEQLKNFLNKGDLVIGLSGSGNSENVIKAIKYANEQCIRTFGIVGFSGGKLKEIAINSIHVKSNDMQKVEDSFSIILHCVMQFLDKNIQT